MCLCDQLDRQQHHTQLRIQLRSLKQFVFVSCCCVGIRGDREGKKSSIGGSLSNFTLELARMVITVEKEEKVV